MRKTAILCMLLAIGLGAQAQQNDIKYEEVCSGVWRMTAGHPEQYNLLSELDIHPKIDAINSMKPAQLPIKTDDIRFEFIDGKTYLRFPLAKGEKIYGLGLNFKTIEQRGRIMRLHVDHFGGKDNGRNHAPVPFFVSSRGYGVLINSARYIDCWIGTALRRDAKDKAVIYNRNEDKKWKAQPYSDNMEFLIPAEGVEIMLYAGNSMLDVVRRFNLMNGGGVLPPKWGLGFWQRVPMLDSDTDVIAEINEFRHRGFPLSVIGLEPGWMTHSYPCTYEWSSKRFPSPQAFMKTIDSLGVKANLWVNPYISPDGELYDKVAPYSSDHLVWCGLIPDYSMKKVQDIVKDHFERHALSVGVSGFKMDENDGYDSWLWPDVALFPSGHAAEQMRQTYGMLMQKMFTDMYRKQGHRTYGLVRAGNAGMSAMPFVLYNDYFDHRDFITALINSSFIGVLWTPEVRASQTADEWLRRMQTACFSPLAMINAWADGKKPWSYPEVTDDVEAVVRLRMQLIPYLYTAFADYAFEGTPPFRAMNLEEGFMNDVTYTGGKLDGNKNPYALSTRKEMKDQYMMGPSILVAPLFEGETERTVVLPKGNWYDFYSGQYVGNGEIIRVKATRNIPLYVKDGALIPMFGPDATPCGKRQDITVRHYGEKSGSYSLYDDDGETYDYERGEYIRVALSYDTSKHKGRAVMPKGKKSWSFGRFSFKQME